MRKNKTTRQPRQQSEAGQPGEVGDLSDKRLALSTAITPNVPTVATQDCRGRVEKRAKASTQRPSRTSRIAARVGDGRNRPAADGGWLGEGGEACQTNKRGAGQERPAYASTAVAEARHRRRACPVPATAPPEKNVKTGELRREATAPQTAVGDLRPPAPHSGTSRRWP